MADVLLAYYRTPKNLHVGFIEFQQDDKRACVPLEDIEFHKMISQLSKILKLRENDRCVMRRLEHPNLNDFVLDDQFTQLIRTDPLAAIRMMEFKTEPVDLNKIKKFEPSPALVAAYDSLADTFGDLVYAKRDDNKVECPLCGDWADLFDGDGGCRIECNNCGSPRVTAAEDVSEKWVGVRTEDLLRDGAVEFFLPRAWHKNGNWITREELEAKYETFLKESEDVRSSKG